MYGSFAETLGSFAETLGSFAETLGSFAETLSSFAEGQIRSVNVLLLAGETATNCNTGSCCSWLPRVAVCHRVLQYEAVLGSVL